MAKVHVFLVQSAAMTVAKGESPAVKRLIRGTLKEVEEKLRQEVEIRPATADEAHAMSDVEIEEAGEQ